LHSTNAGWNLKALRLEGVIRVTDILNAGMFRATLKGTLVNVGATGTVALLDPTNIEGEQKDHALIVEIPTDNGPLKLFLEATQAEGFVGKAQISVRAAGQLMGTAELVPQ
jgi:hypothetical protein